MLLPMISCQTLAENVQKLEPNAELQHVARICLLLSNAAESTDDLTDQQKLKNAWREMNLRLQAATDQHAAVTEELETMAQSDPSKFDKEQVWTLMKVPKKLLDCVWISPVPPQFWHVVFPEPVFAHVPEHEGHVLYFLIFIVFSIP